MEGGKATRLGSRLETTKRVRRPRKQLEYPGHEIRNGGTIWSGLARYVESGRRQSRYDQLRLL